MKKFRAKRSISHGFPGKDQEFKRGHLYDKVPEGLETDFEVVEVEGKKKGEKAKS